MSECKNKSRVHRLAVKLWATENMDALLDELAKLADEAGDLWDRAGNQDSAGDAATAACFHGMAENLREASTAFYASTK